MKKRIAAIFLILALLCTPVSTLVSYADTNRDFQSDGNIMLAIFNAAEKGLDIANISNYGTVYTYQMQTLIIDLFNKYPELFYLYHTLGYSYNPRTKQVIDVSLYYNCSKSSIPQKRKNMEQAANKIISGINYKWSALEKIVYVHDRIVMNAHYDLEALDALDSAKENWDNRYESLYAQYGDSFSAYGILVKKTGVCESYSQAFNYVMKRMGFQITRANSDAMNHVWSMVKYNGAWYHVDPTWNDPTETNIVDHTYIMKTDQQMSDLGYYDFVGNRTGAELNLGYLNETRDGFCSVGGYLCASEGGNIYRYTNDFKTKNKVYGNNNVNCAAGSGNTYAFCNNRDAFILDVNSQMPVIARSLPVTGNDWIYSLMLHEDDRIYYTLNSDSETEKYAFTLKDGCAYYMPFEDVVINSWYYNGVSYCMNRGIMSGTGNEIFSPNGKTTREQVIQILFKISGANPDLYNGNTGFRDAPSGQWYSKAVKWAHDTGVSAGLGNGIFGVGQTLTREQFALLLMGCAKNSGADVSISQEAEREYLSYGDTWTTSKWAVDGVKWVMSNSLMGSESTSSKTFNPRGSFTRAQASVVFMNFENKQIIK